MKAKKKNNKGLIAAIVLIGIFAVAEIVLLVLLHGGKNNSADYEEMNTIVHTVWNEAVPEESPQFLKELNRLSSFEVVGVEDLGEGYYTVTASVQSPDILEDLNNYEDSLSGQVTQEEMDAQLCTIIKNARSKETEQVITVICDTDGKYHVEFSEEFIDAMFGYAFSDSFEALLNEEAFIAKEG